MLHWYKSVRFSRTDWVAYFDNIVVDNDANKRFTTEKYALNFAPTATIGHNAIVHGCTVGDNVLIGMGAVVLNGAKIGDNCIVGAGALVTGKMDAPAGSMLLGSPAKVVRLLTEAEIEGNRESARGYLHAAELCRKG